MSEAARSRNTATAPYKLASHFGLAPSLAPNAGLRWWSASRQSCSLPCTGRAPGSNPIAPRSNRDWRNFTEGRLLSLVDGRCAAAQPKDHGAGGNEVSTAYVGNGQASNAGCASGRLTPCAKSAPGGPWQNTRWRGAHEAHISDVADEFLQNRDHVRMPQLVGKRNLRKQADPDTGQNSSTDRFHAVRRKIATGRHAEPAFWPYKGPTGLSI